MTITTNLGITLVEQSQAQKEVTINQALMLLDAMFSGVVASRSTTVPPSSPTAGVAYIVPSGATGAWAGKTNQIAYFDQIWRFVVPPSGLAMWVSSESKRYRYNSGAWGLDASSVSNTAYPNARPPKETDDTTKAYTVGDRWVYGGNVYECLQNTSGAAVWRKVLIGSRALGDTVSGALGLWGLMKLRSAYAGNCFKAHRISDSTTLDIGFAANGDADWAAFDAFVAGTSGYVTTLYDQSGNGYDLTQTTVALMPRVLGFDINGKRTISWDGENAERKLVNTAIPFANVKNHTAFMIGRWHDDVQKSSDLQIGNPTSKQLYFTDSTGNVTYGFRVNSNGSLANAANSSQLCVNQIRTYKNNNGAPSVQQNNQLATYPITTAVTTGVTGIILGGNNSDAAYTGRFEFLACAYYDSTLSGTNETLFRDRALAITGIQPQAKHVLTMEGDSICLGLGSTSYERAWAQVMQQNGITMLNYNGGGFSGRTAATVATYASNRATRCKQANATNIVIVFAGSNDMGLTATPPATVLTSLQSITTTYRAAGYKVVMCTILPRNGAFGGGQTGTQFEIDRQSLNTSIRNAGSALWDALCDMGGNPLIGDVANLTTYFPADQVHLNDAGYAILAALAQKAVMDVLQSI